MLYNRWRVVRQPFIKDGSRVWGHKSGLIYVRGGALPNRGKKSFNGEVGLKFGERRISESPYIGTY